MRARNTRCRGDRGQLLPLYALIVFVLFHELPRRGIYSPRASLLWMAFLLVLAGRGMTEQRRVYAAKSVAVPTPRGTFYEHPDRAAVLSGLLGAIERSGASSLVVVPEGLAINYLTGVDTPLSFTTFTPIEAADPRVESRIVAEVEARRPQLVAVVTRSTREFGYRGFGVDYDLRLAAILRRDYAAVGGWRAGTEAAVLLRRQR